MLNRTKALGWGGVFLCYSILAWGVQEPFYRGFRSQAMGGASIAVTEGGEALFQNPAALALVKEFEFQWLSLDVELSKDLSGWGTQLVKRGGALSRPYLQELVGKNLDLRAQASATFAAPSFGIGFLGDEQFQSRLSDLSLVQGTLGVQSTYSIHAGFGTSSVKLKKNRGEIFLGLAPKYVRRAGRMDSFDLTDILSGNVPNYAQEIRSFGTGLGLDAGLLYVRPLKSKNKKGPSQFLFGISWKDIGDTAFVGGSSVAQKSDFGIGTGIVLRSSKESRWTLACDYSQMLDSLTWKKHLKLGTEMEFPYLRLALGWYHGKISYGGQLDLLIFQMGFLAYTEELGSVVGTRPEPRYLGNIGFRWEL